MNDKLYIEWRSMSDKALSKAIGAFIKHHRIQQSRTQDSVAGDAGISRSTLSLLERGETVTVSSLLQVLRVLDLLRIMDVFEVKPQISPIELARLEQNKRHRVRSKMNLQKPESNW